MDGDSTKQLMWGQCLHEIHLLKQEMIESNRRLTKLYEETLKSMQVAYAMERDRQVGTYKRLLAMEEQIKKEKLSQPQTSAPS